jgi:hypothetical protein
VRLFLAAWDVFRLDKDPELSRIRQAATLQEAFPVNASLHAYHIKCFWLLKALEALIAKDVKNIIYYHSLVRTNRDRRVFEIFLFRITESVAL